MRKTVGECNQTIKQLVSRIFRCLMVCSCGVDNTTLVRDLTDEMLHLLRLQQSRTDERPGLRDVTVPCTVVSPGADQLCPLDRHTEIHSLATGSELVVIPSAPHLVTLTHPGPVATALTQWLRLVDG